MCVFYYCRTYYKAVRVGGGRRVEDMCYERRRAEACVDESLYQMYIVEAWRVRGKMRGGENIRLPGGLLKTLR